MKSANTNIKILIYCLLLTMNFLFSLFFILLENKINLEYYLFSLFVFFIILIKNSLNILFFIRTFFLGIVGYLTLGSKLLFYDLLFGYSYQIFIVNRHRLFSILVFLAILANLLRGILYQTFAFYKGIITVFILYVLVLLISEFITVFSQYRKSKLYNIGKSI